MIIIYTVDEVADKLSVSKVTIYAKLKKFDDKVVIKQGKKYVTDELFNLIKQDIKVKKSLNYDLNKDNQESKLDEEIAMDSEHLINLNNDLKKTLIEQLKIKDQQLEEKDMQIKELHSLIEQSQKLVENNQVLLKQEKEKSYIKLEEHFKEVDTQLINVRNELEEKKEKSKRFFWNRK